MSASERLLLKTRIDWIDFAKGFGIILVVIGHTLRGLVGTPAEYSIESMRLVDSWIYSFHMPLFFFLSGLFAPRTLSQPLATFFSRKFHSILYPYIIWSAILGLLRVFSQQGSQTLMDFILNFWQIIYRPTDIFWFLYVLFLISATYYLLHQFKIPDAFILVTSVILALVAIFYPNLLIWRPLNRLILYAAYFCIAAFFQDFILSLDLYRQPLKCFSLGALSFGIVTVSTSTGLLKTMSPNLVIALFGIIGIICLSFLCARWSQAQFIRQLGTYSLQIYVAHTAIAALVRTGLFRILKIDQFWVHFVLEALSGLIVPVFLAIISLKFFPYLFSIPKKKSLAQ